MEDTIYFGGALFNGADTHFNIYLAEILEKQKKVLLPQRDGFEFGRLYGAILDILPDPTPTKVQTAVQNVIYALDIGVYLRDSNIMLARCDEPLDPGVDVEQTISRMLGNFNIGYRTDVRSPYGSMDDNFAGMHFFPGFQCDAFIIHPMPNTSVKEAEKGLESLAENILESIAEKDNLEKYRYRAPARKCIWEIEEYAKRLFGGIDDIHSEKGLKEIAQRYVDPENQEFFRQALKPVIKRI